MSRMQRFQWLARNTGNQAKSNTRHSASLHNRRLRVEQLEDRRMLAVITVNNLLDSGAGSLRQAIDDANTTIIADEIQFSVTGTIDIGSQLPTISESLTITGPGSGLLTIDAGDGADNTFNTGDGYRIFDIDDGDNNNEIDVALSSLTLTGGDTAKGADGSSGMNGSNGEDGGAIRSHENLTIIDSAVTGNATGAGGNATNNSYGYGGNGGSGGGIFSFSGKLDITNSIISGNITGNGGDSTGGTYFSDPPYGGFYQPNFGGDAGNGGGIISSGTLIISGSIVSGNTNGKVGVNLGIPGYDGFGFGGGGILAIGTTTLNNSTVSGNFTTEAVSRGGGILAVGAITLNNSTVSGNFTTGVNSNGGGIYMSRFAPLALTLNNSTVSGNFTTGLSARGGGISSENGEIILNNSTVSGNYTTGDNAEGGGIHMAISSFGGIATILLDNSTVSENSTAGDNAKGGGISITIPFSNGSGEITLNSSTVSGNSTEGISADGGGIFIFDSSTDPPLMISNSILAGNTVVGSIGPNFVPDPQGTLTVNYSLIDNTSGTSVTGATGAGNLLNQAPLLDSLAENGGPTETLAILAGSPAIDAGDPSILFSPTEFDQRGSGFPRVANNRIDIGAFEVQSTAPISADFDSDTDIDGFDFLAWQRGFGILTPNASKTDGDADNDQDVDADDLGFWESQFGQPAPVVAVTSSLVLETPIEVEPIAAFQVEVTANASSDESIAENFSANFILRLSDFGLGLSFVSPRLSLVETPVVAEDIDLVFGNLRNQSPEQQGELTSGEVFQATSGHSTEATQTADQVFEMLADDGNLTGLRSPL